MALFRCDMMSQSLLMHTSFLAVIPEDKPLETMPVVYLLHGLTDNCTGWHRFSRVEHYARQKGVALIMPEVQRSFYTDMQAGAAYYIPAVQAAHFAQCPSAETVKSPAEIQTRGINYPHRPEFRAIVPRTQKTRRLPALHIGGRQWSP